MVLGKMNEVLCQYCYIGPILAKFLPSAFEFVVMSVLQLLQVDQNPKSDRLSQLSANVSFRGSCCELIPRGTYRHYRFLLKNI